MSTSMTAISTTSSRRPPSSSAPRTCAEGRATRSNVRRADHASGHGRVLHRRRCQEQVSRRRRTVRSQVSRRNALCRRARHHERTCQSPSEPGLGITYARVTPISRRRCPELQSIRHATSRTSRREEAQSSQRDFEFQKPGMEVPGSGLPPGDFVSRILPRDRSWTRSVLDIRNKLLDAGRLCFRSRFRAHVRAPRLPAAAAERWIESFGSSRIPTGRSRRLRRLSFLLRLPGRQRMARPGIRRRLRDLHGRRNNPGILVPAPCRGITALLCFIGGRGASGGSRLLCAARSPHRCCS